MFDRVLNTPLEHTHFVYIVWDQFLTVIWFNPLLHNVEKWPNILLKSCGVNTARFLKYAWPFFNIMQ